MTESDAALQALLAELADTDQLKLLQGDAELLRFSRDAYDYSPVLREQLKHCRAGERRCRADRRSCLRPPRGASHAAGGRYR